MTEQASTLLQMLVTTVGDGQYAFETGHIDGVVEVPAISDVPRTPTPLAGVGRLRGDVGVFIDGRELTGATPTETDTAVLLDRDPDATPVAVLVDEVHGMERVEVDRLVPARNTRLNDTVFAAEVHRDDGHTPLFGPERLVALVDRLQS